MQPLYKIHYNLKIYKHSVYFTQHCGKLSLRETLTEIKSMIENNRKYKFD